MPFDARKTPDLPQPPRAAGVASDGIVSIHFEKTGFA